MIKNRIILVDDHTIFRTGLRSLVDKEPMLKVVGEAKDGKDLLDLVILDLSMPNMDGMAAIKEIRQKFPKVKILVLTMQEDSEHFKRTISSGAAGDLLKDDAYEQLVTAVKLVLKGKQFVSPSIASLVTDRFIRSVDDLEGPSLEILTKRERQILRLVASGLANKNIAAKLKISVRTVETHRSHLTDKLGIKNTAGLVKLAYSKGLI